jgi:hypothetical protein
MTNLSQHIKSNGEVKNFHTLSCENKLILLMNNENISIQWANLSTIICINDSAEIRNLHIDLLYSKYLVYERYLSKPKFCFNLK